MKKILTVLGARPQFIKASVVSHAIAATPGLTEVLVHTGQHFDANMSDVFFAELGMARSDYFLGTQKVPNVVVPARCRCSRPHPSPRSRLARGGALHITKNLIPINGISWYFIQE